MTKERIFHADIVRIMACLMVVLMHSPMPSLKKYNKRGNSLAGRGYIPNCVDIEERPAIVDLKKRFGDLEIDTVIGSNHKGALVTINDRLTSSEIVFTTSYYSIFCE